MRTTQTVYGKKEKTPMENKVARLHLMTLMNVYKIKFARGV